MRAFLWVETAPSIHYAVCIMKLKIAPRSPPTMFQINFIFEMPSCFCTEMKDALRIMFLSQIHFVERDDYFYNTFKFGFDAILVAFGYQQKIKIDKNL